MLKTENLTKKFGDKTAVDGLSLHVEKGDIFGFIGHNGAGKTTTIKCATGLLAFDDGEVFIDGKSVKKEPLECKKITAYIPDNPDLYEFMTGIKYLNFVADVYGVPKAEREEKIAKYADMLELTPDLSSQIGDYSHGMKQKLAIVAALCHSPKLIIMDEPFVGLDPKATFALKETMKELCKEGCAFFFSTHVLEVAEKLCNKVAIIKNGKLVVCGDTDEIVKGTSLESVFLTAEDQNA